MKMNLVESDDRWEGVAVIRFSSPNEMNSLGIEDIAPFIEVVDRVAKNGSARALIIEGGENVLIHYGVNADAEGRDDLAIEAFTEAARLGARVTVLAETQEQQNWLQATRWVPTTPFAAPCPNATGLSCAGRSL